MRRTGAAFVAGWERRRGEGEVSIRVVPRLQHGLIAELEPLGDRDGALAALAASAR